MKSIVRWWVASLVTIATFATGTWVSGALILPTFMKDSAIRWGVAGGFGVAVAALAALWGHSFASAVQPGELAPRCDHGAGAKTVTTRSGSTHNEIRGGTFHRQVIQSRDFSQETSVSGTAPPQAPDPKTKG
jgi:hypothetical protein